MRAPARHRISASTRVATTSDFDFDLNGRFSSFFAEINHRLAHAAMMWNPASDLLLSLL
jgi:hypothetical protein